MNVPEGLRKAVIALLVFDALCLLAGALLLLSASAAHAAPAAQTQPLPAAKPYERTLKREAQRVWGLQAPVATFAAQVQQESRWRADARSPVGASGLTQFMPSTANWIGGLDVDLAERAPLNPTWALRALVVYDRWLFDRVRTAANECERMAFTLAAYNGGLGWVYKRQAQAPRLGLNPGVCMGATCSINPGISDGSQHENERYPPAIFRIEPAYLSWGRGVCS